MSVSCMPKKRLAKKSFGHFFILSLNTKHSLNVGLHILNQEMEPWLKGLLLLKVDHCDICVQAIIHILLDFEEYKITQPTYMV